MGSLFKTIIVFALLLMISACATTSFKIPERYMLDNQLERVTEVPSNRLGYGRRPTFADPVETFEDPQIIMARRDTITFRRFEHWTTVDQQSLIMNTTSSDYYLLVFDRPAVNLMATNEISFTLRADLLSAGGDFLELGDQRYLIDRIYKIINSEQMNTIINQIKNSSEE